jgi:hypothetical protein
MSCPDCGKDHLMIEDFVSGPGWVRDGKKCQITYVRADVFLQASNSTKYDARWYLKNGIPKK